MNLKNKTLRETISIIKKKHLKKFKTMVFGQNLLGVGQVDKTLPKHLKEQDGIIDLPMAKYKKYRFVSTLPVVNPSFTFIEKHSFTFNMIFIINYACKSKAIWKLPCPIWIRGIASEGNIGPVAGSTQISQFYKMPGIKIFSPINSKEYFDIYKNFLKDDDVYYISEHRKTYSNTKIIKNRYFKKPDVTLMLNSITRHAVNDIERHFKNYKNLKLGIINLWRQQVQESKKEREIKNTSKKIIICDNDYVDGLPINYFS